MAPAIVVAARPVVNAPWTGGYADQVLLTRAIDLLRRSGNLDRIAYDEVCLALDTDRDRAQSARGMP